MWNRKSSSKYEELEIILLWHSGAGIIKFFKGYRIGVGVQANIEKIINCYSKIWLRKWLRLKILISRIFHRRLFMGLGTMDLKEVGISIIGQFGPEEPPSKAIKLQLGHSIANSEHRHYRFGSRLSNLLKKVIDHINLLCFSPTKGITVSSVLSEIIWGCMLNPPKISKIKLTLAALSKHSVFKSQSELKEHQNQNPMVHFIGNSTTHGLQFHGHR